MNVRGVPIDGRKAYVVAELGTGYTAGASYRRAYILERHVEKCAAAGVDGLVRLSFDAA